MLKALIRIGAAAALAATLATAPAAAGDKREEAIDLVEDAAETVAYFSADSAFEPMWSLADDAKAMVVIPDSWRAGFMLIGGSGGDAVMIARNRDGGWSQPTFFAVGSANIGFQAGVAKSEIILLVMTQRGMEHLLSTSVKLGADVSIAAGPVGAGAKAQTTDILAFSRSRGLYGGLTLEGAVLKTRKNFNKAYYSAEVTPAEIVFKGEVYNPVSASLQTAAQRLARRDGGPMLAPAVSAAPSPALTPAPVDPLAPIDPYAPQQLPPAPAPVDGGVYEDDAVWGAPIGKQD